MPSGPEPYLNRLQARMSKGDSLEEAAEHLGLELWRAKATFVRAGVKVPGPVRRRRPLTSDERERLLRPRQQPTPDAAILITLQSLAVRRGLEMLARGPVHVPATYWDAHRDPAALPTSAAVKARFGGWGRACERAGIPVRPTIAVNTGRRWTPEECLVSVRQFFAEGAGWTSTHYSSWAKGRDVPTGPTVISHLGPWPALRTSILG